MAPTIFTTCSIFDMLLKHNHKHDSLNIILNNQSYDHKVLFELTLTETKTSF